MALYHSRTQCHVIRIFRFIPHSLSVLCILQVFAGIFPSDHSDYLGLRAALEKLTLNDSSVELNVDSRYDHTVMEVYMSSNKLFFIW